MNGSKRMVFREYLENFMNFKCTKIALFALYLFLNYSMQQYAINVNKRIDFRANIKFFVDIKCTKTALYKYF